MPRFEEEIWRFIEKEGIPAIALLVSRKGEILYRKAFGYATLQPQKEPVAEDSWFDIASLTKPLATTSLALLARQENRITLDTSLSKLLEELQDEDKERITVRHLLKHTSGLPAWRPYFQEVAKEKPELVGKREASQVYLGKLSQESLEVPIAYQKIYSDLGFILLGIYLERLHQQPLDRLFEEKVANPLELKETFFQPCDIPPKSTQRFVATEESPWRKKLLRGEVHDDNAYTLGGVAGHAGLFSTLEDLHRFLTEIERGRRGESPLFQADLLQEFIGPKVKFKLGWDVPSQADSQAGKYFSRSSIGHLGYTGCSFWVDLDADFHIILLTNRVHPTAKNESIKKFRPLIHDLIYEELIR